MHAKREMPYPIGPGEDPKTRAHSSKDENMSVYMDETRQHFTVIYLIDQS